MLIGYHFDANKVLATPLKNRHTRTITEAWIIINEKFTAAKVTPNTYVMNNKASWDLKKAMKEKHIDYQLVPPHIHRKKLAEKAAQTFKSHCMAGLASLDPNFTLSEWDMLIPHAELTLNLLRAARSNLKLSAWAYLFGQFIYMATTVVRPGIKVLAHDKPVNRPT